MDNREKARAALHDFVETKSGGSSYFFATVFDVDKEKNTCDVKDYFDTEWFNVRLKSSGDSKAGIVYYPKSGSDVLIGKIKSDGSALYVAMFGEIEQVQFKFGGEDLKEILSSILDEIVLLTVPTPSGPSSPPVNAAKFTALKTKIQKIFK